jgi:hypothetical protein
MQHRRPGRPPLDDVDPSVQCSLRLPAKQYDALYRAASRDRVTVPEYIRTTLSARLRYEKSDEPPPRR